MRLLFILFFGHLLIFVNHYDLVMTSFGGRTMYIKNNDATHMYEDDLNISLYYSIKRVAIKKRGVLYTYYRSYSESEYPIYLMHNKCKHIPNKIFLFYDSNKSQLYIRHYHETNIRKLELVKTEVYKDIKLSPYNTSKRLPKKTKRYRCRKLF